MQDAEIPGRQKLLHRISYRLTHKTKLPKGEVLAFMRNIAARGFYPKHVVDVGANRGTWSRKVRTVYPQARFTLIEPQVEMSDALNRFCRETDGARWIQAGVGARKGEMAFTLSGPTTSSFAIDEAEAAQRGWERRKVPVITLDDLCSEELKEMPDIVKLDAEGFEFEILKGARTLLGRVELFLLELPFFTPRPGALGFADGVRQMSEYGYDVYDFTWFNRRPHDGALGQAEVAFARRDGFLRAHKDWE